MSKQHSYRRDSHCTYLCDYHIVLSTKYRKPIIDDELWDHLYGKLIEVTTHYPKLYIHQANHDTDHIHLMISIPPQKSVGSIIRLIKTNTSRGIKKKFPILKKHYWGTDSFWSSGYFVSTVGVNQSVIKRYIEKQGEQDVGQTTTLFD